MPWYGCIFSGKVYVSNEQKVYLDESDNYVDHKVSNSDDLSIIRYYFCITHHHADGEKMLESVLAVDAAIIVITFGMVMVVVSAVVYAVVSTWESTTTSKDKKTKAQKEYEVRIDKILKHYRENTVEGVNTARVLLFGTGVFVLSSSMM